MCIEADRPGLRDERPAVVDGLGLLHEAFGEEGIRQFISCGAAGVGDDIVESEILVA